jgi:N-acetylmuramoyl-L-alanine amidase
MKQWPPFRILSVLTLVVLVGAGISVLGKAVAVRGDIDQAAAVYFSTSITTDELRTQFQGSTSRNRDPIKVLIMPGHEPDYSGAEFRGRKERDMNVDVARYLIEHLALDGKYAPTLARDKEKWLHNLDTFFKEEEDRIRAFMKAQKELTQGLVEEGNIVFDENVHHGDAPSDVALRLYGINLWASERDYDIVLHLHFNDTATRNLRKRDPSGVAIYIPDDNYSNHEASRDIAEHILERLSYTSLVSNNRQESEGVIESEKLIALGANNTLDPAAVLIEYGYIYELRYREPEVRELFLQDHAWQTYLGLKDFFEGGILDGDDRMSLLVPLTLEDLGPIGPHKEQSRAAVFIQGFLFKVGFFPPAEETLRSCPIDGFYGSCTKKSVQFLQETFGLPAEGIVGEETIDILENLHILKTSGVFEEN